MWILKKDNRGEKFGCPQVPGCSAAAAKQAVRFPAAPSWARAVAVVKNSCTAGSSLTSGRTSQQCGGPGQTLERKRRIRLPLPSRDPSGLTRFIVLPALPRLPARARLPGTAGGPPPPAPPSLGHVIATDGGLQPPACSALPAGRGGTAASATPSRHHQDLKISPMVHRGLPLIGRAGGRCAVQSRRRSARPWPERGGGWGARREGGRLARAPGAPEQRGFASLPPTGFAPTPAMASLSFQGGGGAKKEEKGKNIQVVVRCR